MRRRLGLRWLGRLLGGAALALLLLLAAAYVVSADVRYVVRVAVEEAGILLRRRPITDVAADSSTDPATRAKLLLVLAAREFAAESLGLEAGQTYTTYSRVGRDTLVLLLSASRSDRLAPYTWRYPIVGRVPYKGFFSFEQAARAARQLERAGLDTYIRPANAYSTLGWFEDPLLSTIVREDSAELVATVIHEITHNTVFVPGHVDFNESFASLVGYRGAEQFFRSRGDRRNAERAAARWRDELRLGRFYANLVEQLERLYAPGIAGPQLREARIELFRMALARLAGGLERTLETIDGRRLSERPLNNAVVLASRVYRTNLDALERLVQRSGGLRAAVERVKRGTGGG
ncbi:MAG TPA: aminopeptidase, partial [Gemmatimonadales bacterium]|nr:aminopeptidase [Gemmatimonadales bacterium]